MPAPRLPRAGLPRAQIEQVAVVRVHRHPLAVAAAVFVSAEFEGHIGPLERLAAVLRPQDGAIGRARVGISAAGQIQAIGVRGVQRDAFHAHQVEIFVGHPIEQRIPPLGWLVPAVRAAHIGTGVAHALGGGMKDDSVHKSPAHNLHALPVVRLRGRLYALREDTQSGCQKHYRRRQELPIRKHGSPSDLSSSSRRWPESSRGGPT